MSPGHKREIAKALITQGRCSARQACHHFGLHRSTFAYEAKAPSPWLARLKAALRRCSRLHPELGYPKITELLKNDGWDVGRRLIQRLRRELGLAVPTKKPRQRRRGESTGLPTKATHRGHVWTWDFVHDTTVRGGKLRMLNVIDEHTRECLCIHLDRRINAAKVQRILARLIAEHGAPKFIRSDNGSEFIEKNLRRWLKDQQIDTLDIDPGSPWQNGYIESFNARLREECLNRELLYTLTEARVVIEDWRFKYNHIRPHRSLGYITPIQFTQKEILTTKPNPGMGSVRSTTSLRPSLDFLNQLYQPINTARLTKALEQFA
ncbi:MAG: IS3 family transposase [Verrucomicrobiota bacterium]